MDRAEMIEAQRLHIRLLYDEPLAKEYEASPEAVLERHGLGDRWQLLLPDPSTDGHKAEMYGRRVLAAQELMNVFSASMVHLVEEQPPTDRQIVNAPWFKAYLASNVFFEPSWSLPHPAGFGRAYDGYSRFFFWARDHFGLREEGARVLFRDDLYLDMAAHLDNAKVGAIDPDWERLSNGFFWSVTPKTASPVRGLSANREVFRHDDEGAKARLVAEGLCDLDELMP